MALPDPADDSTALVTGASSGIGAEIAHALARRGHGLTLVARRADRLTELAEEIGSRDGVRVETHACDLSDASAREGLAAHVRELGLTVEVLVNNAGFGGFGDFADADLDRQLQMVHLNVEAVVDLTGRYLPAMVERGRGAVINVASTAAFQPQPSTATYAATKAFVLSFSEAVHSETRGTGVSVTAVCPGPVRTEFTEAAGAPELESRAPDILWSTPETVAESAVKGAARGRRTVVVGLTNQVSAVAGRHLPRSLLLPLIGRAFRPPE